MISDGVYTYTTIATAATTDEQGVAATANMRLMGYSIRETAAGAAVVELCHGTSNATPIVTEAIAASGSVTRWLGDGVPVPNGIWIERISGGSTRVVLITKVA